MHKLKISHFDIKPGNILVQNIEESRSDDDSRLQVKIIDFGISKYVKKQKLFNLSIKQFADTYIKFKKKKTNYYTGTIGYMFYDHGEYLYSKHDIWATGIVLIELLTNIRITRITSDYDVFQTKAYELVTSKFNDNNTLATIISKSFNRKDTEFNSKTLFSELTQYKNSEEFVNDKEIWKTTMTS
jgi:serine/threonine protein kinase